MRTNILLDDELIEEAFSVSKVRTKKDLIHEALNTLILVRKKRDLTELSGKIKFYKNYNYKILRKLEK